jgi:hypothetical protein
MTRGPDGRTPNGNPTPSDRHDILPRQTRDWLVLVRGSHHREMTGVGVEEQCALGDRRRCIQVPAVVEADDRFHDRDAPNRTRAMATKHGPGRPRRVGFLAQPMSRPGASPRICAIQAQPVLSEPEPLDGLQLRLREGRPKELPESVDRVGF